MKMETMEQKIEYALAKINKADKNKQFYIWGPIIADFAIATIKHNPDISMDFVDRICGTKIGIIDKRKASNSGVSPYALAYVNNANYKMREYKYPISDSIKVVASSPEILNEEEANKINGDYKLLQFYKLKAEHGIVDKHSEIEKKEIEDAENDYLDKLSDENFAVLFSFLDENKIVEVKQDESKNSDRMAHLLFHELNHVIAKKELCQIPRSFMETQMDIKPKKLAKQKKNVNAEFIGGLLFIADELDTPKAEDSDYNNFVSLKIHEGMTELLCAEKMKIYNPLTQYNMFDACSYQPYVAAVKIYDMCHNNVLKKAYLEGKKITEKEYQTKDFNDFLDIIKVLVDKYYSIDENLSENMLVLNDKQDFVKASSKMRKFLLNNYAKHMNDKSVDLAPKEVFQLLNNLSRIENWFPQKELCEIFKEDMIKVERSTKRLESKVQNIYDIKKDKSDMSTNSQNETSDVENNENNKNGLNKKIGVTTQKIHSFVQKIVGKPQNSNEIKQGILKRKNDSNDKKIVTHYSWKSRRDAKDSPCEEKEIQK